MPIAVTTYLFVKSLHVMAVVAAYGLPMAYPMLLPYVRRRHPEAMAGVHDVQHRLNVRLTGPGTVLIAVFGVYLASKGHHWDQTWVAVPVAILVVIAVVGGGFIVPVTARLSELARADLDGPEYARTYRRYMAAEILLAVLVLVAVLFMAAKPFA